MQTEDRDILAVFVSHGSPMVAIERGLYQDALAAFGRRVKPDAVLVISAHWDISAIMQVSSAKQYQAVHDFGGFPQALYGLRYSPPGSPALANRVADILNAAGWEADLVENDGLDHGAWIPLHFMYPEATTPVVQLSLPLQLSPQQLYQAGQALAPFRAENVLILGSGGIVHNLRMFRGGPADQPVAAWASEFDEWVKQMLEQHDAASLLQYEELGPYADLAVPTFEHFAPLFIVLGAAPEYHQVQTIFEGFQYGSISMRSFALA